MTDLYFHIKAHFYKTKIFIILGNVSVASMQFMKLTHHSGFGVTTNPPFAVKPIG